MHQRFAAGKDDPAHSELPKAVKVRLEVLRGDLSYLPNLPDVAHHAAAVTAIVRKQDQNRQVMDKMIAGVVQCLVVFAHALTRFPASRTFAPRRAKGSLKSC